MFLATALQYVYCPSAAGVGSPPVEAGDNRWAGLQGISSATCTDARPPFSGAAAIPLGVLHW